MGQHQGETRAVTAQRPTVLKLSEYAPQRWPREEIPRAVAEELYRSYSSQVAVEFPSLKTHGQWQLTAQGWVGYIHLAPDFAIALRPKVQLGNLFRMLEYAYRLQSFEFLTGLTQCRSLREFYERLAHVLARRVLDRGRRGFYRAYLPVNERLPYARGRLEARRALRTPWKVQLPWHYERHTPNVEDNRILAWTLFCVARSAMCTERVLPAVRRAYRSLQGLVTVAPLQSRACVGRVYHRLNEDYRLLHALCRFFLEHAGPHHDPGDRTMLPFLVNMERLFELFVAEWLKAHLPPGVTLRAQEPVSIGAGRSLQFRIDLVLYDEATTAPLMVLDTKYKSASDARLPDVAQVVTYAQSKGCAEAILIYPTPLPDPFDAMIGDIRIRTLTFALDGDLEHAGESFLQTLLAGH